MNNMLTKTKLDKMFDEKFEIGTSIGATDIVSQHAMMNINGKCVDVTNEDLKQFIYTAIDSVIREVVGEKREQVDEWDIKVAIENKYIDKQLTKYKEMGYGDSN